MSKSVRIDDELYHKIEVFAADEDRPVANALERLIKLGLGISRPSENKKVEIPNGVGSQANKEEANAEHMGRREVFTVPQLISKIEDIRQKADEEAEYCQDHDTIKRIYDEAEQEIAPIQAEIDRLSKA